MLSLQFPFVYTVDGCIIGWESHGGRGLFTLFPFRSVFRASVSLSFETKSKLHIMLEMTMNNILLLYSDWGDIGLAWRTEQNNVIDSSNWHLKSWKVMKINEFKKNRSIFTFVAINFSGPIYENETRVEFIFIMHHHPSVEFIVLRAEISSTTCVFN